MPIGRKKLTEIETVHCRQSFQHVDRDNSGTIDLGELKQVLNDMGQTPTEEELFVMISSIDEDGSGGISFPEFLKAVENQKFFNGLDRKQQPEDESDFIDAFVALGGKADMSGNIESEKLKSILEIFDLSADVTRLVEEADIDGSGYIEYGEFKDFLKSNMGGEDPFGADS